MPVRKRASKARPDEAKAWMMYFQSGHDFFDELVDAGVVEDRHHVPRDLAEATWRRIGNDVLAYMEEFYRGYHPPEHPIWAEREFGAPGQMKRRAGR
ncbi:MULTISPECIES: hypothetical protein [unclassified Mesorhizobium]|uniref:hypothetical protein n=1 Tax=unclassified Mesorhizobium TaxID=325217 RepID=UPI000FCC204D|nr:MULTISPECIES: hypothetical protein [unclassified Mesorhizobium]RVD70783.1 hypothetical protein EN751_18930 [Mesorhizobium sp. M4A.F.Ca.ET.029.04.2.1]RUW71024.1 hypothetical protein EOA31_18900 [Mesorhizobium sp. M4B.F.Ca.ET.049.02.1.2]TGV26440.1 hypothetical protein EN786_13075 [Mesorhizobium sp. M4B.F.Ca.ET.143.01.1.1]TIW27101.1 MAG: hypothetical protein E5V63_10945 [Mesorhizobium sp.]TIW36530.1 MAG: hypothetical protein E5V62_06120 [Mesorhizobium sp.]